MFGFQVVIHFLVKLSMLTSQHVLCPGNVHSRNCESLSLQKDNVSNQREHLILLLANVHIRQSPKTEQQAKVLIFHFCSGSDRVFSHPLASLAH